MVKENKVVRVMLTGGIIGMLATSPQQALADKIAEENAKGWSVRQVLDDSTGNLLIAILRFLILICTVLLYTTRNGYFIIMEREIGVSDSAPSGKSPNTNVLNYSNKSVICPNCKAELPHGSAFCGECGQKIK